MHTQNKKRNERNATAVGVMLSEYTVCAELPCYEPSVAKAWPQPIRHNKTEECCTRNENRNKKKQTAQQHTWGQTSVMLPALLA